MPEELDPAVAEVLVSGAIGYLPLPHGNKVLCTKRQLRECMFSWRKRRTQRVSSQGRRSSSICRALGSTPPGWTFSWMIRKTW